MSKGCVPPQRWGCAICSYCYDATRGDPEQGIPEDTPFDDLPSSWKCPWCGVGKDVFYPETEEPYAR